MKVTHGKSNTRIYHIWENMKQRCTNPNTPKYNNYGGRGIKVCKEWLNSFENFLQDMGEPISNNHTLDRINNDGNYEPSNCRWTTIEHQNRNCRVTSKSGYKGVYKVSDNIFTAQISINNKKRYIGCFKTAKLAHYAYLSALKEHICQNI